MSVKRIYVEKKAPYAVKARELKEEAGSYLGMETVSAVRVLIRYDMEHLSDETYERAKRTIFSEPPVDEIYEEEFPHQEDDFIFSVEYLPGQFDQRADSAMQCVKLLKEEEEPLIRTAVTYVISGALTKEEQARLKAHCINPVDSREAAAGVPDTLRTVFAEPEDVKIFDGFTAMSEEALCSLYDSLGLAMTFRDFLHIREGGEEGSVHDRNPCAGYLLVGSLPAHYVSDGAEAYRV